MDRSILMGIDNESSDTSLDKLYQEYSEIGQKTKERLKTESSENLLETQIKNFSSESKDIDDLLSNNTKSVSFEEPDDSVTHESEVNAQNQRVMRSFQNDDNSELTNKFINEDEILRTKQTLLTEIDDMRETLIAAKIKTNTIPNLTPSSDLGSIELAHKLCLIKLDNVRFRDWFEEIVVFCAKFIELMFDGEREIFGTSICFEGLSLSLRMKLKTMRTQTTAYIRNAFERSGLSDGARIFLELVPHIANHVTVKKSSSRSTSSAVGGDNGVRDEKLAMMQAEIYEDDAET